MTLFELVGVHQRLLGVFFDDSGIFLEVSGDGAVFVSSMIRKLTPVYLSDSQVNHVDGNIQRHFMGFQIRAQLVHVWSSRGRPLDFSPELSIEEPK